LAQPGHRLAPTFLYRSVPPRSRLAPLEQHEKFGHAICGRINAKNRYGGYAGYKTHYYLIHGGGVVKHFRGADESKRVRVAPADQMAGSSNGR
jgi:hypothetical protein